MDEATAKQQASSPKNFGVIRKIESKRSLGVRCLRKLSVGSGGTFKRQLVVVAALSRGLKLSCCEPTLLTLCVTLRTTTTLRTNPGMVLSKLQLLESDEGKQSLIARQMRRDARRRKRDAARRRSGLLSTAHASVVGTTRHGRGTAASPGGSSGRSSGRASVRRGRRGTGHRDFQAEIDAHAAVASGPSLPPKAMGGGGVSFSVNTKPGDDGGGVLLVDTRPRPGASKHRTPMATSATGTPFTPYTPYTGEVTPTPLGAPAEDDKALYRPSAGSIAAQVHSHRLIQHFRTSRRMVQVRRGAVR